MQELKTLIGYKRFPSSEKRISNDNRMIDARMLFIKGGLRILLLRRM
jgi:hypothetical protein